MRPNGVMPSALYLRTSSTPRERFGSCGESFSNGDPGKVRPLFGEGALGSSRLEASQTRSATSAIASKIAPMSSADGGAAVRLSRIRSRTVTPAARTSSVARSVVSIRCPRCRTRHSSYRPLFCRSLGRAAFHDILDAPMSSAHPSLFDYDTRSCGSDARHPANSHAPAQ